MLQTILILTPLLLGDSIVSSLLRNRKISYLTAAHLTFVYVGISWIILYFYQKNSYGFNYISWYTLGLIGFYIAACVILIGSNILLLRIFKTDEVKEKINGNS